MNSYIDRAVVVLTSAVLYIQAASAGLVLAADKVAELAPPGHETAGAWILRGLAVLAGAVTVIRRVTPVLESARGLLPARTFRTGGPVGPPSSSVHIHVAGSIQSERDIVDTIRRAIARGHRV